MDSSEPTAKKRSPMAVTGIGIYSSLGSTVDTFWNQIDGGKTGLAEIRSFPTSGLKVRHAAEIADHIPSEHFKNPAEQELDWTAQFGIIAARQAIADAGLAGLDRSSNDLGLIVGVCAGGQGASPPQRSPEAPFHIDLEIFPDTSIYRQTDAIGKSLGIHGPRVTVSTACASSGSALGTAFDMLQEGGVDAVAVGGTDAFSISTYAGFYALGAMPEEPISPFSEGIGVSFGEGAGFVILEPLEKAEARGAKIYGLMLGYGCTGDAHHVTAPHPSGEGLQRAMSTALKTSGLEASSVDYINAHGTATRDNDRAETSAIRELCNERGSTPPVSSSKSQFGHTLGAAGILEFIVSILAQKHGRIPPTINFTTPRPGCDLDYVPNASREGNIDVFLSNSAAFGGINVSVAGGSLKHKDATLPSSEDEIWITGLGVVSPIGSGIEAFRDGLLTGKSGIAPITEFDAANFESQHAALMGKFKTRKLAPTLDVRRTDPLNRYAMVSAALALKHSGLEVRPNNCTRVGMVMSLSNGSLAVQQRFRDSLDNDGLEKLSAKHFPSMVVSTIGGTVSQSFNLKGYNSTIVDGITGGLSGLIHAHTMLRQDDSQDAAVVIAADEVASNFFQVYQQRGWLADTRGSDTAGLGAYQSDSRGWLLGEGGAALVLERAEKARARGATPLAIISGYGQTSSPTLFPESPADDCWHQDAIESSLKRASIGTADIDLIYGHGRGQKDYDAHELNTLEALFGQHSTSLGSVMGNTGVASATSGLYSVLAGCMSLHHGEVYPVVGTQGDLVESLQLIQEQAATSAKNVLITGSTENGNHSAVVLSQAKESK